MADRAILGPMDYSIWFASLPGVAVAALTAYLSESRLRRAERIWDSRAGIYMELVDLLGEHNREMWKRLDQRISTDTPLPAAFETESGVVQQAMIIASAPVKNALSNFLSEVCTWRETDEHRLDSEPKKYLGHTELFGDRWHTPADDFICAGETVDIAVTDLCAALQRELVGVR